MATAAVRAGIIRPMSKLLLLILIGVALYLIITRTRRSPAGSKTTPSRGGTMIRCAHCGLHIPAEEGVVVDDQPYCCEEHRRLGRG